MDNLSKNFQILVFKYFVILVNFGIQYTIIYSKYFPSLPPPALLRWWSVGESMFFLSTHLPSVLIKGLKQLHENQKNNPALLENKSGSGVPNSNSNSSVQHVQIRVARLEDNTAISPSPMAALQIPVQITHVCKCLNCSMID